MELCFRKATLDDLPEITRLFEDATRSMEENGIHQWDEFYPDESDYRADIEARTLWVGTRNGAIVVAYTLNTDCDEEYSRAAWQNPSDSFCVLHRLCVHPAVQHRGIATRTMRHILETLQDEGTRALRLDVYTQNPHALRLYESLGFQRTGTADWRKGRFVLMERVLTED